MKNKQPEFICPESKQTVYYPLARCNLNDKICQREVGFDCPTYEDLEVMIKTKPCGRYVCYYFVPYMQSRRYRRCKTCELKIKTKKEDN